MFVVTTLSGSTANTACACFEFRSLGPSLCCDVLPGDATSYFDQPSWNFSQALKSPGFVPMPFTEPSPRYEPDDMTVQNPVEFSPPAVSYWSGRPRSCAYSCANTPRPPFSGCIV